MLSQLLEDYKDSDPEDKKQYVDEFKRLIWNSKYTYKAQKRYINFKLNASALDFNEELIEIFMPYQTTEISLCKSFYSNKLKSPDYIRIRINNMYGYLTKPEVYLPKDYYKLLLYPKDEYYETIEKIKIGEDIDIASIKEKIEDSYKLAEEVKNKRLEKKIDITWRDYKQLINTYIDKLFENYTPLHEYEAINGWEMEVDSDDWSEDNYVVRYFCKSLTGYMRHYIRDTKIADKNCLICNVIIGKRGKYCGSCSKIHRREYKTKKQQEYRKLAVDT